MSEKDVQRSNIVTKVLNLYNKKNESVIFTNVNETNINETKTNETKTNETKTNETKTNETKTNEMNINDNKNKTNNIKKRIKRIEHDAALIPLHQLSKRFNL
jgi:hypothetical protein